MPQQEQAAPADTKTTEGHSALPQVLLVPGIINPARLSYGPLLPYLQGRADFMLKELEVYRADTPPPGYTVATEAEGIFAAADACGWQRFHLVGYSAGGIAALAAIEEHPERLLSVVLIEPFGTGLQAEGSEEAEFLNRAAEIAAVPESERVSSFLPLNLREGVQPPPPASPEPDWMGLRPAGIAALARSAGDARFSRERLRSFTAPVLVVYGGLSNPAWDSMAETIAATFSNIEIAVYAALHHLSPPQRAEPQRFAQELLLFWDRAEEHTT